MQKPTISMIAVIGENRELGKNNQLLWHLPADLNHFKKITDRHPVIMGRKTFSSIGKPLPNRINIIVSRDKNFQAAGIYVFSSIEDAIEFARTKDQKEFFIIGGASIYTQGIQFADKLYLTLIKATRPDADAFFPDYSDFNKVISSEEREEGGYKFTFLELTRSVKGY